MDTFYKTLPKRHRTTHTGIYYKEIQKTVIDDKGDSKVSISDKSYSIQIKDNNGKWVFKTIGKYSDGIREAYCKKKRTEALNQANLGEQPDFLKDKEQKKATTINDIFELYKKQKENESKDFTATEQKYNSNILPELGHRDIHKLTTDEIVKFRKYLKDDKKLADATVNGNIAFIGTLFNLAIEEGIYTKVSPIKSKKLKSYKLDNTRDRYFTKEDIKELLEAVADDEVLNTFVQLSLSTGGRLETILNIQKKDINIKNQSVTLKDLKNNSTYTGFLTDDVVQLLNDKLNKLSVNSYIVGGTTTKFATRTLQRKLQNIINELFNDGLDTSDTKNRAVIHTLRHTFASLLAIQGTPIFTIQKLMNHSDIKMTLRYAKLSPDSGLDAVKKLFG